MQHEDLIIKRITQVIAGFWIMMKIICLKVWLKERSFPLVPIVDMPAYVHIALLSLFFVLTAWIIYKPGNNKVLIAIIVTELVTLLGDQTRLQPWHYQYICTFFVIATNLKDRRKAVQGILLIIISTYIFSGLQKLNYGFVHFIWAVYILKIFLRVPSHYIHNYWVEMAGYIIPAIEIGSGIALLFFRTRQKGAWMLIGMHLFLLIFMGPLGINYNIVVWPWNVIMIFLLYFLFIKNQLTLQPLLFGSPGNYIIAFLWIVMPIFGLIGKWDKFLSSAMYSGRVKLKQFYFEDRNKIPQDLRKYAFYNKQDSSARIVITDWCMNDLNVAAVTEKRMLKSIEQQLNDKYAGQGVKFVVTDVNF